MKTLITFESFFGNTETIARSIAQGLSLDPEQHVHRVSAVTPQHLENLQLIIVGSATRGFTMCPDTKTFLKGLPPHALRGVCVAAYDTRVDIETVDNRFLTFMVTLFGYAAEKIEKKLKRLGGRVAGDYAGFIVEDSEGPLREGEQARAQEWARGLRVP